MHEHLFYPSGDGIPIYSEEAFSFPRLYLASGITTRPHGRQSGAVHRSQRQAPHRQRPHARPQDAHHGAVPGRRGRVHRADARTERPRRRGAHGGLLGRRGRHLVQGLHEHHPRRTEGGGGCGAPARHQSDRPPVLDRFSRGRRPSASTTWSTACWWTPSFTPASSPINCPAQAATRAEMAAPGYRLARRCRRPSPAWSRHNVAITSTLAVFEAFDGSRPPLEQRFLDVLSPQGAVELPGRPGASPRRGRFDVSGAAEEGGGIRTRLREGRRSAAFRGRPHRATAAPWQASPISAIWNCWWKADSRPWRRFESPPSTAPSSSANRTGSARLPPEKQADLVVIDGNPAARIADIRKVTLVFKDGVGYDPGKLLESVRGAVPFH